MNLEKEEHVILEVRKHWYIIASEISIVILVAISPLLLISILSGIESIPEIDFGGNFWAFFLTVYTFWLLVCWIVAFIFWTNYYLDVWVITNKKLIDIEQVGLFKREVSILELEKIQDVTSEIHGLMPTLLNFGEVHVQTAGSQREFIIDHVENPDEVRNSLHEALRKNKTFNQK